MMSAATDSLENETAVARTVTILMLIDKKTATELLLLLLLCGKSNKRHSVHEIHH